MSSSQDWGLYVETSPDGCGKMFPLDCGDLTTLQYDACGRNEPLYERDYWTGNTVEVDNVNQAPNLTAALQIPESEADYIKKLHERGCVSHIQRRNCVNGVIQHFIDMILKGEAL